MESNRNIYFIGIKKPSLSNDYFENNFPKQNQCQCKEKKKNSSTASLTIQSDIIRILLGRELGMSNEG